MSARRAPWRGLGRLLRPSASRTQLVVALLCCLLGFGLAVQVGTSDSGSTGRGARPEDLVRILDDLTGRSDRLRAEIESLRATRDRLGSRTDRARAALEETGRRARTLAILAGTVAAHGPGVVLSISDPEDSLPASVVLDAVEELRDAGAEAMEIGGAGGRSVRVVASTYFLDASGGGVAVDGTRLGAPYRITALGDPATLVSAMRIPGGVVDTVAANTGATAEARPVHNATVAALHRLSMPRYARPAPSTSGSG